MGKASWLEGPLLAGARWTQSLGGVTLISFLNLGEVGTQSEGVSNMGEVQVAQIGVGLGTRGGWLISGSRTSLAGPDRVPGWGGTSLGLQSFLSAPPGVGSHTLQDREPSLPPLSRYRRWRHAHVRGTEMSDGGFSEMGVEGSRSRTH